MKTFLTLLLCVLILSGCSDDDSVEFVWDSKSLPQTLWEGEISVDGKEEKVILSFDSSQEGYCYLTGTENQECLFEYSVAKTQINFYNTYGDSDKLIIDGLWHFVVSEQNKIKLQRIKSADHSDYLTLSKK